MKEMLKKALPPDVWRAAVRSRYRLRPSPLDPFRRLEPIAPNGQARGLAIDRYYIQQFLGRRASLVQGHVLEVADNEYTSTYGHDVVTSDVLHVVEGNPKATIVGDLASGKNIPVGYFDCIILTQVLQFIYDFQGALFNLGNALKPGGTLLLTVPGIAHISRYDADRWGDYWRFTQQSLGKLSESYFGRAEIEAYGNVLTAAGLLHYLAAEDFTKAEREANDPDYPVILGVVATRAD
jgi:SAM-dependent methyltransferase